MEDIIDIVENWGNPRRELLKQLGLRYGLRPTEIDIFERLYQVWLQVMKGRKENKDRMLQSVAMYYPELRRIASQDIGRLPGTRRVARRPVSEKYVIFSDHHMLHRGHRHDYFHTFHNKALYSKVLEEYAKCDFTLVENGDVEELLIMEPTEQMSRDFRAVLRNGEIDVPALTALRKRLRMQQLDTIINDNEALYDKINSLFYSRGKYIRMAGNHDTYDDPDLLRRLRVKYPKIQTYDILALHPMKGRRELLGDAEWLVAHGHQFDPVTCPLVASLLGELNSETLSWIYEGPDRKWDWNDDVQNWINGTESFINRLARAHPENIESLAKAFFSSEEGSTKNATGKIIAEMAMGHEVAWEYFESPTNWDALAEVWSGDEFFKIRHLSEEDLSRDYNEEMWQMDKAPNLVVGHSHEPRHNALCSHNLQWKNYMNSGSAGRFQNLLFAIEVENGVGKVVSWHNADGPSEDPKRINRRVWTPENDVFKVGDKHEWMCSAQQMQFDPNSWQDTPPNVFDPWPFDSGLDPIDG